MAKGPAATPGFFVLRSFVYQRLPVAGRVCAAAFQRNAAYSLLACSQRVPSLRLSRAGRSVAAEDMEKACSCFDLVQGLVEFGWAVTLYVQKELILPRAPVDGAAFNFQEVDAMIRKRLQRG